MELIEIKSDWLASALGARNNKITLEELNNTRILDFNLLEYLRGNSDVYFSEIKDTLSEEQIIYETNLFMSELSKIMQHEQFDISRISLSGLDFAQTDFDPIYEIEGLQELRLQDNQNCKIELEKLPNIKEMTLMLDSVQTKILGLSDYTMQNIGLEYNSTQYDLYLASQKESFKNIPVDISDIKEISQYTNVLPNISIKKIEELRNLKKMGLKDMNISLRTSTITDLVELSQFVDHVNDAVLRSEGKIKFNQVIDNVSELSLEQMGIINDKIAIGCDFGSVKIYKAEDVYEEYDIHTYEEVRGRIDELLEGIDVNSSDIEKFIKVQNKIAYTILYDNETVKEEDNNNGKSKNSVNSRNLVNGLLNGKCICMGYADILRNMLECVGVSSNCVVGELDKEGGHAWNQVRIDYNWYNTDITKDACKIVIGSPKERTLKSDNEFKGYSRPYKSEYSRKMAKECLKSYDPMKIEEMYQDQLYQCTGEYILDIVEAIKMAKSVDVFVDCKEVKDCYNIGVKRTEIRENEHGEKQEIQIDTNTTMAIDKEDIGNFVRIYLDRYQQDCKGINDEEKDLTYITTQKGIGLIIGANIRKRLCEEGIVDLRNNQEKAEDKKLREKNLYRESQYDNTESVESGEREDR